MPHGDCVCSMESVEENSTAPPPSRAVSFTFSKKVSTSKVRRDVVESSRDKEEKEGKDFVVSLEGKEIQRFVIYE